MYIFQKYAVDDGDEMTRFLASAQNYGVRTLRKKKLTIDSAETLNLLNDNGMNSVDFLRTLVTSTGKQVLVTAEIFNKRELQVLEKYIADEEQEPKVEEHELEMKQPAVKRRKVVRRGRRQQSAAKNCKKESESESEDCEDEQQSDRKSSPTAKSKLDLKVDGAVDELVLTDKMYAVTMKRTDKRVCVVFGGYFCFFETKLSSSGDHVLCSQWKGAVLGVADDRSQKAGNG